MKKGGRAATSDGRPSKTMSAGAGSGAGRLQKIGGGHGYQRSHPDGRAHLNYQIGHPFGAGDRHNYQRSHPFGSGRHKS
jgi:hypothetical protein